MLIGLIPKVILIEISEKESTGSLNRCYLLEKLENELRSKSKVGYINNLAE
jgi:hypothetical protein